MADAWGASWGGAFTRFIMWGAATQVSPPPAPSFGPPFLDLAASMRTSIGLAPSMRVELGLNTAFPTTIEARCLLPSSRISRSVDLEY
jgi:hypothetical protein